MKTFNYQAAISGSRVIQRNGMEALIVGKLNGELVVDLRVTEDDGYGVLTETELRTTVGLDGRYNKIVGYSNCDLFMVA